MAIVGVELLEQLLPSSGLRGDRIFRVDVLQGLCDWDDSCHFVLLLNSVELVSRGTDWDLRGAVLACDACGSN